MAASVNSGTIRIFLSARESSIAVTEGVCVDKGKVGAMPEDD